MQLDNILILHLLLGSVELLLVHQLEPLHNSVTLLYPPLKRAFDGVFDFKFELIKN